MSISPNLLCLLALLLPFGFINFAKLIKSPGTHKQCCLLNLAISNRALCKRNALLCTIRISGNRCTSITLCKRLRFRFLFNFIVRAQSIIGALYIYAQKGHTYSVPICNICMYLGRYIYKYIIYFYPHMHLQGEKERLLIVKKKTYYKIKSKQFIFLRITASDIRSFYVLFLYLFRPCFCFETNNIICDEQHTYHTCWLMILYLLKLYYMICMDLQDWNYSFSIRQMVSNVGLILNIQLLWQRT